MFERSQTTTLLQLFCELLLYSKVISKSIKVADDEPFQSEPLLLSIKYPLELYVPASVMIQ